MVQDGEIRTFLLLAEHKHQAAWSERVAGGPASLEDFGTGWANTLGNVLTSADPAPGLRDGPDGFSRSSQALVFTAEALGAAMFASTFPGMKVSSKQIKA